MKESIRKFTYYIILNLNFRKDNTMQTAKRFQVAWLLVREKTELIVKDDFTGSTIQLKDC